MKIAVASGKGGVGKSMLASSLAIHLSKEKRVVACDCDVDAPNLGIWLGIDKWKREKKVSTSKRAEINRKKCTRCGRCAQVCRFGAIRRNEDGSFEVNPLLCEGCGACTIVCPVDAIEIEDVQNGEIRVAKRKFWVVSGLLRPGESGSGKIVSEVKKRAGRFKHDVMVIDSAAGIGCPVIASVRGADFVVLVTEPTHASFSDMKRMAQVVEHFGIPYGVVVNIWDMNKVMSDEIEGWASNKFLGRIRHSMEVVRSMTEMEPVIEGDADVVEDIVEVCDAVKKRSMQ